MRHADGSWLEGKPVLDEEGLCDLVGGLQPLRRPRGVLRGDGDRDKVAALRTPIGLPIGAETPEELGVAIAGELVAARHGEGTLEALRKARRAERSAS